MLQAALYSNELAVTQHGSSVFSYFSHLFRLDFLLSVEML